MESEPSPLFSLAQLCSRWRPGNSTERKFLVDGEQIGYIKLEFVLRGDVKTESEGGKPTPEAVSRRFFSRLGGQQTLPTVSTVLGDKWLSGSIQAQLGEEGMRALLKLSAEHDLVFARAKCEQEGLDKATRESWERIVRSVSTLLVDIDAKAGASANIPQS